MRFGRQDRRAFTLVELMMVALVISLLMSMLVVGVWIARRRAKEAQIALEISQLDMGLQSYKDKQGKFFPPSSAARIPGHMANAFSRYTSAVRGPDAIQNDLDAANGGSGYLGINGNAGIQLATLDAAELLVFWLAGPPDPDSGEGLMGFSADPLNPMAHKRDVTTRLPFFFEFRRDRLRDYDQDGWPEYIPPTTGDAPPYVYFEVNVQGQVYPDPNNNLGPTGKIPLWGFAVPYEYVTTGADDTAFAPANAGRFQIISAGIDNNYGSLTERKYPSLTGTSTDTSGDTSTIPLQADLDNITNFTNGTLGAAAE